MADEKAPLSGATEHELVVREVIRAAEARSRSMTRKLCLFAAGVLLASNLAVWYACRPAAAHAIAMPLSTTRHPSTPELLTFEPTSRVYSVVTPYNSDNASDSAAADRLWDAFTMDVGVVGVDRTWARARAWPNSMAPPGAPDKAVYVLQGYHLMHCLQSIRHAHKAALAGRAAAETPEHTWHCYDALRQSIVCAADATPMASMTSPEHVGEGQALQCGNWAAMRDWAGAHSACYAGTDDEAVPVAQRFGHCNSGDDGMLL